MGLGESVLVIVCGDLGKKEKLGMKDQAILCCECNIHTHHLVRHWGHSEGKRANTRTFLVLKLVQTYTPTQELEFHPCRELSPALLPSRRNQHKVTYNDYPGACSQCRMSLTVQLKSVVEA